MINIEKTIIELVKNARPKTGLILSGQSSALQAELQSAVPTCVFHQPAIDQYLTSRPQQHGIAILYNALEYIEKKAATSMLSQLRDVYSRHMVLSLSINNADWSANELTALGLNKLAIDSIDIELYEYNIINYKNTPDWLNAKNWANPEQWDKHRW